MVENKIDFKCNGKPIEKRIVRKQKNFYNRYTYVIFMEEETNFITFLEIKSENKNYITITRIGKYLNKINKTWSWLISNSSISENTWKSYLSGMVYITLHTLEEVYKQFSGLINSPRKLMNRDFISLRGGRYFELNIREIMTKYRINRGDIHMHTGIDSSCISDYFNRKTKQLRIETLDKLFNFFSSRGVPLKYRTDLIYFPLCGELPLHFLPAESSKALCRKYNTKVRPY